MRIRSIKPEFWRSDDIAALAIEDRLLFVGLWSYVDDSGVGVDKTAHICADLFAPDLEGNPPEVFARVTGGLQRLADRGLILRYEAEGRRYLYITNWEKHQRIDKPSKRRFPLPDKEVLANPGVLREDSRSTPENVAPGAGEQGNRGTGEQKKKPPSSEAADAAPRPDVDAVCDLLADRIASNGVPRPKITETWRKQARLLMDKDGYTQEQVAWIINWSHDHTFWRGNILSMPKLREKFPQLKIQAMSQAQPTMSKREREIQEYMQVRAGGQLEVAR